MSDKSRTLEKKEEEERPPYEHDPPWFREWSPYFIERLSQSGNVSDAAEYAGVARSTVYKHRNENETFSAAWDDAMEIATDALEAEARRRAVEGTTEPVGWYQGQPGGYVTRYSDNLLMFLLKAHRPEKFRERYEFTGKDGGPLQHEHGTIDEWRAEREHRVKEAAETMSLFDDADEADK